MPGTRIVPTTSARRVDPVRHTVTRLAAVNLSLMLWFWASVLPFVVVATLVIARLDGPVDAAVVLYARHAAIWFPFSQAIILVAAYVRVHVAAGMTRRTFGRATLVVGTGTGVAYALVLAALALVERAVHTGVGWGWRVTDAILADASSPAGLLLAELVLCCVVGNVAGLLVGAAYQRWGGLRATLLLPLTAGPVLGVLAVLGWAGGGQGAAVAGRGSWSAAAPALAASVLVVVLEAAAYAAVVRRTPVRPPLS